MWFRGYGRGFLVCIVQQAGEGGRERGGGELLICTVVGMPWGVAIYHNAPTFKINIDCISPGGQSTSAMKVSLFG